MMEADLKAVSESWASGLNTRKVDPALARQLVERGATLTPHAAAGLGFTDELARMLAADPAVIDAKGCDAYMLRATLRLRNYCWHTEHASMPATKITTRRPRSG